MKIMQKIFLILSFTLLSICALQSCDGNGHIDPDIDIGIDGITGGSLKGVWVPTRNSKYIGYYWEFKGGMVYYYEINYVPTDMDNYYAEFKDGVLYVPKGRKWKLMQKHKFKIEKGVIIYVDGYKAGYVNFLSKDKAVFAAESEFLYDGVVERVKQFKEKPINNSK